MNFVPVSADPTIAGRLEGTVSKIYPVSSINNRGESQYKIEIEYSGYKPTIRDSSFPSFSPNVKGNGQILISDKPVLKRILGLD